MTAGYSGTPLYKKLGIKDGFLVKPVHAPDAYMELIAGYPDSAQIDPKSKPPVDLVHAFYKERTLLLGEIEDHIASVKQDGMIWLSWPKKASKVPTDITEDVLREVALPLGIVDVKVCAVDAVWSGLKFVIRKELRK